MKQNSFVIGLTGSIGSGKSAVSSILAEKGADVIDADMISREIFNIGENAYKMVVESFGKTILAQDGTIDRKKLAQIVFSDEKELEKLNSITHPEIISIIKQRINESECDVIVIDAPLLIECELDKICDVVWVVTAPIETRLERIIKRDNCTLAHAKKRTESQMSEQEKIKYADVLINNGGTLEQLREIVNGEYKKITKIRQ